MKRITPIPTSIAFAAALIPNYTMAQEAICGEREVMTDTLQTNYGESLQVLGSFGEGENLFATEIWANPETGTFTILETFQNGISCMASFGENWTPIAQALTANDATFIPYQIEGSQTVRPMPF